MNDEAHVGIDPGADGGAGIIYQGTLVLLKSCELEAPSEGLLGMDLPKIHVWMEKVSGMQGDKPNTAFVLGDSNGIWRGASLFILKSTPVYVSPQIWQTRFARHHGDRWCPKERKERKTYIHERIKALFPGTKITKPLADAAAIAWLGWQGKLEDQV